MFDPHFNKIIEQLIDNFLGSGIYYAAMRDSKTTIGGSTTRDRHDPYCQDAGPNGDFTIPQRWDCYTSQEHARWDFLFNRQVELLGSRAASAFLEGVDLLRLADPGIPDFDRLSDVLEARTGWRIVAVPGLIPEHAFFDHLAHRRFPAGDFIRSAGQLDYLQEPDVFHDVFGHVPMLANPVFADYMQAYGQGGLRAIGLNAIDRLSRLYWYTVEFGLVREAGGHRIFGAGIVSSYGETLFAFDNPSPNRIGFDMARVMRTRYRIDDYQPTYFVVDSFEDMLRQTQDTDFAPLYERLSNMQDIAVDATLYKDRVITHDTQSHVQKAAV
jgi:phenylalanine-4-hydroxylase